MILMAAPGKFDSETMKKLFYYCLKRTGGREEAEDLAGEITLEMLAMLGRGYEPLDFHAWMWTVARAKYSLWVKRKKNAPLPLGDISGQTRGGGLSLEDEVVRKEEISLMRRELAGMSREYREITVAYYIENMKISEISKAVNLPEGTVKRKLYESRKYLKEGMDMIRTYGKRSYAPEHIEFYVTRGATEDDVPFSLYKSKLAKNILLEAYGNPCTVEELSVALGVAAPYLEEEIEKLTNGLLLAKITDPNRKTEKYATDFIIVDREAQKNIFQRTAETAEKICLSLMFYANANMRLYSMIDTLSFEETDELKTKVSEKAKEKKLAVLSDEENESLKKILKEHFSEDMAEWKRKYNNKTKAGTQSPDDSMWFHIFKNTRDFIARMQIEKELGISLIKSYKGYWNITGFEDYPGNIFSGYAVRYDIEDNPSASGAGEFFFKFYAEGLSDERPTTAEWKVLADIIKNSRAYNALSETEKAAADALRARNLISVTDNEINPAFPVIFTSGLDKLPEIFGNSSRYGEFKSFLSDITAVSEEDIAACQNEIYSLYEYNLSQIKKGLPQRLEQQAKICAWEILSCLTRAVCKYITENSLLPPPSTPAGIGMYICE